MTTHNNHEINIKIVYYGPALSGKTTNLEHIYSKLPPESKGKMVSMKTRTDRTLFFDFLPLKIEKVKGTTVKFLIYTVPGQVYYNATRKLVLNGVDAVVFVADSTTGKMDDNIASLNNLKNNLSENGLSLSDIPMVIQYNKRDAGDCVSIDRLEDELNETGAEFFEAVAVRGKGVYETFESIARKVFKKVKNDINNTEQPEISENEAGKAEKEGPVVEYATGTGDYEDKVIDSEADESKSLNSAEESKEEHNSVSEFVDQVLSDDENGEELEFESADEDFREYGHTVELGDARAEKGEAVPEVAVEFINDPLEDLDREREAEEAEEEQGSEMGAEESAPEAIVIPVRVPREKLEENDLEIVLQLEIE
ncbi:MAG: GTPase domain-containing protein [Candidatus Krumholzibacteriales bacterium]